MIVSIDYRISSKASETKPVDHEIATLWIKTQNQVQIKLARDICMLEYEEMWSSSANT